MVRQFPMRLSRLDTDTSPVYAGETLYRSLTVTAQLLIDLVPQNVGIAEP